MNLGKVMADLILANGTVHTLDPALPRAEAIAARDGRILRVGTATACFFQPYADDPNTRGLLAPQMFPEGIMEKRILEADRTGLQVAIHAIGDRANSLLLDIYEKTAALNSPRDRRWRIEHAQHLRRRDHRSCMVSCCLLWY